MLVDEDVFKTVPKRLRTVLAALYKEPADAALVAEDAGLLRQEITFSNKAENYWQEILSVAIRHNRVQRLLEEAEHAYPDNVGLCRAKLWYLLQHARVEEKVIELYRMSRPSQLEGYETVESVDEAVEILWEAVDGDDRALPILEFVEWAARWTQKEEVRRELRRWSERVAAQKLLRNVTKGDIEPLRRRLDEKEQAQKQQALASYYLLVDIIPDAKTKIYGKQAHQCYWVQLYLWEKGKSDCPQEPIDEGTKTSGCSYAREVIPLVIHKGLAALERQGLVMEAQQLAGIELLLPDELLLADIEQWPFYDEYGFEQQLGREHKVVIRSWERLCNPQYAAQRQRWRERWRACGDPTQWGAFTICRVDEYGGQALNDILKGPDKRGMRLGLMFAPPSDWITDGPLNPLGALLTVGVPVIVWAREAGHKACSPEEIQRVITQILHTDRLGELPRVIYEQRKPEANHISNQMALFLDDPARTPRWQRGDTLRV